MEQTFEHKDIWTLHRNDMLIEVMRFGVGSAYHPEGRWCFYLYIYEGKCQRFEELWLEDKQESWGISHDYYDTLVSSADWNGDVTYYAKHGHTKGYRCVQFGCDFSHSWDEGRSYSKETICHYAIATCDEVSELLKTP